MTVGRTGNPLFEVYPFFLRFSSSFAAVFMSFIHRMISDVRKSNQNGIGVIVAAERR